MNIIKKVVVFVMGVIVIGVVATTIGVVTQPKNVEKNVTFELLENGELTFNVFDQINVYAIYGNDFLSTNLLGITVNNIEVLGTPYLQYNDSNNYMILSDDIISIDIINNSTYESIEGLNVGDIITITFDVEVKTPAIIKTLLFLTPLILSASLIGYLMVKGGKNE